MNLNFITKKDLNNTTHLPSRVRKVVTRLFYKIESILIAQKSDKIPPNPC